MTSRLDGGPARTRARPALMVAMMGFFVVVLDTQVVNIALPYIRADLGGGLSDLQWVIAGYTLVFSALILLGGVLSDGLGARRVYGSGMILFVVASAVAAAAPSLWVLVGARVAQGIGAALLTPTSLALIREAFHDPDRRTRAIGIWATGGTLAAATGPVLGGLLATVDWRLIFVLNVPVGALALAALSRVPASERRPLRVDLVCQTAALVGLLGLGYGLIEGGRLGFATTSVIVALVTAVVAAGVFAVRNSRSRHPTVPRSLVRAPRVVVGLATAAVSMAAYWGAIFVQGLAFQDVHGVSAVEAGLLFLPMTALVAAYTPVAGWLARRVGIRVPVMVGHAVMVGGLVALALVPPDTPVWILALLMIPVGIGGTTTIPPLTTMLLGSAPPERSGTMSALLNTFRQVGGALGTAGVGAAIALHTDFSTGAAVGLLIVAVLLAAGTVAGVVLPTRLPSPAAGEEGHS